MRIGRDLTDAQVIILQDVTSSLALHFVVMRGRAPSHDRLLVTPIGERQDPPLTGQAPVANILDEPVDLLELRAQQGGVVKICIPLVRARLHFKHHREHWNHLRSAADTAGRDGKPPGATGTPITAVTKEDQVVRILPFMPSGKIPPPETPAFGVRYTMFSTCCGVRVKTIASASRGTKFECPFRTIP